LCTGIATELLPCLIKRHSPMAFTLNGGPENAIHSARSVVLHRWRDVAVNVQGYRDTAVAEALLNHLGVDPRCQHCCRGRVAQAVEVYALDF